MSSPAFNILLERYAEGVLAPAELADFLQQLQQPQNREALEQALGKAMTTPAYHGLSNPARADELFQRILLQAKQQRAATARPISSKRIIYRFTAAAAILVLLLGAGYFIFFNKKAIDPGGTVQVPVNDALPGGNRATLTLANGSTINLDSAANGLIAQQGNATITLNNGQVVYKTNSETINAIVFNTMTTPRGGQYKLTLPDGSQVWLNAASSITYPVAFSGNGRKVTITGEAYFEVARDATKPFYVNKGNMQVQVLGTHFNVNAYDDEDAIRVTLLEGSVKIKSEAGSRKYEEVIKPGEQVRITTNDKPQTTNKIDLEQVMAWKNGLFSFANADIQVVMRQLSRWYDVEVIYEGGVPAIQFQGKMQRDLRLSQVVNILQQSQVQFRIDGRKLIVQP